MLVSSAIPATYLLLQGWPQAQIQGRPGIQNLGRHALLHQGIQPQACFPICKMVMARFPLPGPLGKQPCPQWAPSQLSAPQPPDSSQGQDLSPLQSKPGTSSVMWTLPS